MAELADVAARHRLVARARILNRYGLAFDRAHRTRLRWEGRWETAIADQLALITPIDVEGLLSVAEREWRQVAKASRRGPRRRSTQPDSAHTELVVALEAALARDLTDETAWRDGAEARYMGLAYDESEDAGQSMLDALGLDSTFRWTSARDMVRDMFAVRGSKIVERMYPGHIQRLRDIIISATDPARPRTQSEIRREIRQEWERLTRYEAERIARTETASVWETTNVNTAIANGVTKFDWAKAQGPSIGPPKSEDVCPTCTALAAGGPYEMTGLPIMPPAHPNCRCTLIPAIEEDWLPPIELWNGGPYPDLPLIEAPVP